MPGVERRSSSLFTLLEGSRFVALPQYEASLPQHTDLTGKKVYLIHLDTPYPRDAQRVLPQQQSGLRAFFIASLFRGGGVKVTVTSRKVEPEERKEPSSDLCIGK